MGASTHMVLSAKQAADAVGLSRNGIIKSIKEGRISGEKNAKGEWEVEPSELFRVYKAVEPVECEQGSVNVSASTPPSTEVQTQKIAFLEEKIADLQNQLKKAEEREEKLQQANEKITEMADRQTRLLEHQTQKTTEKPAERKKKGWLW